MKIVVTGGLGFIGSSFVKMASARMADVVVATYQTHPTTPNLSLIHISEPTRPY